MTTYTGAWDREQVAAFLDEAEIPVRLACTTPSGHLWMVSLWFRRRERTGEDGEGNGSLRLECATSRSADVVGYLRADPGIAFEISTNDVPYRGIRGRGEVRIEPDEGKATLRGLIERYLGGTESELAGYLLSDDREEVALRIDPAKVYSWDFSKRMKGVDRG